MNEYSVLVRIVTYVEDPQTETLEMTCDDIADLLTGRKYDVMILEGVTRRLPDDEPRLAVKSSHNAQEDS